MRKLAKASAAEIQRVSKETETISEEYNRAVQDRVSDAEYKFANLNLILGRQRQMALLSCADCETKYLTALSAELQIPLPEGEHYWEQYLEPNKSILTTAGIDKLRKDVRREQKERFEVIQSRLALFFGTLGAVTGVASLVISLATLAMRVSSNSPPQ